MSFEPPDEFGVVRFGDMRLGLVELGRLEQRRDNPRAMGKAEYETLKRSMERFGFKSFVVAEELAPGRYGVIDGHHRWRAAQEMGKARVPIVLLEPGTDKSWADLAMLTFNVTGDPLEDKFVDLLAELTHALGADTTAAFTALDASFLENFTVSLDDALEAAAKAAADTPVPGAEPAPGGPGAGGWQGKPVSVEFPRTQEAQELLEQVVQLTGETVVGLAVLRVLREWVSLQTQEAKPSAPAQDESVAVDDSEEDHLNSDAVRAYESSVAEAYADDQGDEDQ